MNDKEKKCIELAEALKEKAAANELERHLKSEYQSPVYGIESGIEFDEDPKNKIKQILFLPVEKAGVRSFIVQITFLITINDNCYAQ